MTLITLPFTKVADAKVYMKEYGIGIPIIDEEHRLKNV
jgi:hypothetical protein